MERISKWDEDMREERELAKFLDAHFYQKLLEEGDLRAFGECPMWSCKKRAWMLIRQRCREDGVHR